LVSAKECVTTQRPNGSALKMDGAQASNRSNTTSVNDWDE